MEEVLTLLMTLPDELPEGYLVFEAANHAAYGVATTMYPDLFHAVRDVIRDATGDDWDAGCEAAWEARIDALTARIAAVAPDPVRSSSAR